MPPSRGSLIPLRGEYPHFRGESDLRKRPLRIEVKEKRQV